MTLESTSPFEGSDALAFKKGKELLDAQQYARVTVGDLKAAEVIPLDKTYTDFVKEELGFGVSIAREAFARFAYTIPKPIDEEAAGVINFAEVMPQELENELRSALFQGKSQDIVKELKAKSGMRDFAMFVVDRLGQFKDDTDETPDPTPFIQDLEVLSLLYDRVPRVIGLNGGRYWSLSIPSKRKDGAAIGLFFPGTIDDYLVVVDPQAVKEVSNYIFTQPDLLRFFLAEEIIELQLAKQQVLDRRFADVAIKKYAEKKAAVAAINYETYSHLFDLLKKEVKQKGSVTIISIFRDRDDIAVMEGRKAPIKDRTGIEGGAEEITVSLEGEDLVFAVLAHDYDQKARELKSYTAYVYARYNQEKGLIELGEKQNNKVNWETLGETSPTGKAGLIETLLWGMEAITIEQWLGNEDQLKAEFPNILARYKATASLTEFFGILRDGPRYPAHEFFVKNKVLRVEEVLPDHFRGDSRSN